MVDSWNVYESFDALLHASLYHIAVEGLLIVWIVWLMVKRPNSKNKNIKLSKQEEEDLLNEWNPDPLIPKLPYDEIEHLSMRTIEGKVGKYVTVNNKRLLNLASMNFLNMDEREEVEHAALDALQTYGVGSCGPRGFYGTTEVHLQLESKLAEFMQREAAALYSYGFSTIASAIPAYSKSGDIIIADECVNFAIQRGIKASRSSVYYFKHNDMSHLEEILEQLRKKDYKNPKKASATRKFLIVEGIYQNTGNICLLPEIVTLRQKFKLRLFVDESISLGTMGSKGRGVIEHFGIPTHEVDLVMASLEYGANTTGGFTVGTSFVVEHQRLSGLGYCFSASLPSLLASAAVKFFDILDHEGDELITSLQENCIFAQKEFNRCSDKVCISGDELSPIKFIHIKEENDNIHTQECLLYEIVQKAEEHGLAVVKAAHLRSQEHKCIRPAIRLAISKGLSKEEIKCAANSLRLAVNDVLK